MSDEDRLNALLDQWEHLTRQGTPADPRTLCRDCPQLLPELTRQIEALWKMDALFNTANVGPTQPPGGGNSGPPDLGKLDLTSIDAGRYEPLSFHAAGGLGRIFVAHDTELKRNVALKLIKNESPLGSDNRRRFELEAEITGRLEHPGVVPVYGFGLGKEGHPYYAMRFIRGERLEDAIQRFHQADADGAAGRSPRPPGQRSLELQTLLRSFLAVCQTVAYAHSRGVIHRDLKPANVMLGKYGETLVVDWGLAKAIDPQEIDVDQSEELLKPFAAEDLSQSLMGLAKGTTAYMSPEQAEGRWDIVGTGSDVYSLGVMLYTLLTGKRAFEGDTEWEIIDQVRMGTFVPPQQANFRVHAALEAVCLKAMQKLPLDRYTGAQELAADIEQWLADEPVSAWREPATTRARRWLRRHRALLLGTAAAALVALVVLTLATILLREKNVRLQDETNRAEANFAQARNALATAYRHLGVALGNQDQWDEAWKQFAEARRIHDELMQAHPERREFQTNREQFLIELVKQAQRFLDGADKPAGPGQERPALQLAIDALAELKRRSPLGEVHEALFHRWSERLAGLPRAE